MELPQIIDFTFNHKKYIGHVKRRDHAQGSEAKGEIGINTSPMRQLFRVPTINQSRRISADINTIRTFIFSPIH